MRTETKKLRFDIAEACRAGQEFNSIGGVTEYGADDMRRAAA